MIPGIRNLCCRVVRLGTLILLTLVFYEAKAQYQQIQYGLESSVYAADAGSLPFWFYSNANGIIDPSSTNFTNHFFGTFTRHDSTRSVQFSGGIDAHARLSGDNTIVFSQLYGQLQYHGIRLTAGRFYDPMGLNEHDLSMGSLLVSRNTVPVPKVQLGTDGFVLLPGTNGQLLARGMVSHGWFTEKRYIDNPNLHQKYLYVRYQHDRFDFTVGAAHNAVWGGTHPGVGEQSPYQLPSSFSDYLKVVLGQSASEDSDNVPDNEITNTVGNSVAAYEGKLGINFEHFRFKVYRLFYLEDKVALRFRSPWDGMWGTAIELDNSNGFVTKILWEHMNTKRQNAWIDDPYGRTNYYNNGVYRSGWAYQGKVLGNPLIINRPVSGFDGGHYPISNNIIVAHHIGIKGKPLDRLTYKAFFTYSRNYGTSVDQGEGPDYIPLDDLRTDEFSSYLKVNYNIAPDYGLSLNSSLAYDVGNLYADNRFGFQIGIRWEQRSN
ncbi:capsule assembly Wzi family protein [Fodinibius salsisoli]|uniref:Capsule assembly protein Wzi n=1 Tax=Fodinibius salsisoli TaxID=2820877 RepID=A0ABT3PNA2_9BACT|nr:capsule assembly Wzi family protein [Fodinibius salsisoli]MCW9707365.1 hypothetical protein [Fodinibius salsisoli]